MFFPGIGEIIGLPVRCIMARMEEKRMPTAEMDWS